MSRPAAVPVTVVTGFLGAGKTTFLNRVLSGAGGPVAVILNEFGSVPVDGHLVERSAEEIVELANGCICCTVRDDLSRTLRRLLRRRERLIAPRPFQRILIETSGLASPGPLLQTLILDDLLAREVQASGVVTLVNAVHGAEELEEHVEAREQAAYADALLLNHADRATAEELERTEAALRALNPLARVARTTRAEIDVETLLRPAPWGPADLAARSIGEGDAEVSHTPGAAALVLEAEAELDLHKLKLWLGFLAQQRQHELWRIKGVLACAGHANEVLVQGVHQWLELGPGEGEPPTSSLLVLIGRGLDAALVRRGWDACRSGA